MAYPINLLVCCLTAFFLVLGLTPLVKRLHIIDQPNPRKIHKSPVPKAGGLALAIAVFAATGIWSGGWINPILALVLLTALLGLWDDLRTVSPVTKLVGQVLIATVTVLVGCHFIITGTLFDPIMTVLWLVAIMNAFNLIDGMDGLASGVAIIGLVAFIVLGLPGLEVFYIVSATIGGCLAFLWFNWHPAKIFMGDTGSLMLGYLLGVSAITISRAMGQHWLTSLTAIVLVLIFPLFDVALTIIRRARIGRPVFAPDRSHTYNLVVDNLGWSTRKTVVFFYAVSLVGAVAGLVVNRYNAVGLSLAALLVLGIVGGYILMRYSKVSSLKENYQAMSGFNG